MRAFCAWCQSEGLEGVLGEREPLEDTGATHGICPDHEGQARRLLEIRQSRKSGLTQEHLDGRARDLGGWRIASHGRMLVYTFPFSPAAELFAGAQHGMVIRGGRWLAPILAAVEASHE